MDNDIGRQIGLLRDEIAALAPGDDPAWLRIRQSLAGALFAIAMAGRHGYLALARARSQADPKREEAVTDAALQAIADRTEAPTGDWFGDFFFGSALLRVAAASQATLRQRYLPLMGEGFCRSRTRLEEQAGRDGLITESDRRLLASIREAAETFGQDRGEAEKTAVTSLEDLVVALRLLAGVAQDAMATPRAGEARG